MTTAVVRRRHNYSPKQVRALTHCPSTTSPILHPPLPVYGIYGFASVSLQGESHEAEAAGVLGSSVRVCCFDEIDPLDRPAVREHGFDVLKRANQEGTSKEPRSIIRRVPIIASCSMLCSPYNATATALYTSLRYNGLQQRGSLMLRGVRISAAPAVSRYLLVPG